MERVGGEPGFVVWGLGVVRLGLRYSLTECVCRCAVCGVILLDVAYSLTNNSAPAYVTAVVYLRERRWPWAQLHAGACRLSLLLTGWLGWLHMSRCREAEMGKAELLFMST